jgi:hypothetical protein
VHRTAFEPLFVPFVLTDAEGKKTFGLSLCVPEQRKLADIREAMVNLDFIYLLISSPNIGDIF